MSDKVFVVSRSCRAIERASEHVVEKNILKNILLNARLSTDPVIYVIRGFTISLTPISLEV